MAVLHALGIDSTVLYQFIIATLCFFALSTLVFGPYTQALFEREKRTKGGEEEAVELTKQAAEMRAYYEQKAREINGKIKTIFDASREESSKEHEVLVSKARAESQKVIDDTRARVTAEVAQAAQKMKDEVPLLAQAMTSQLLSKKA